MNRVQQQQGQARVTVAIDNTKTHTHRTGSPQTVQAGPTGDTEDSVAFGALMNALRAPSLPKGKADAASSPNQMFEPGTPDARDGRLGTLKSIDQENRSLGTSPTGGDSTSVAARRAEQSKLAGGDGQKANDIRTDRGASESATLVLRNASARPGQTADASSTGGSRSDAASRGGVPAGFAAREASVKPDLQPASTAPEPITVKSAGAHAATPMHTAGDVATARPGGAAVAERIGEVLATGKTGEAQTTRVAGASAPGSELRGDAAKRAGVPGSADNTNRGGMGKSGSAGRGSAPGEFADLVKSIRMNAGLRRSSAKMQLNPPSLGRVHVDVQMKDNVLEISVRTESDEATSVLRERADTLRHALENYGVQIERFDINWDNGSSDHATREESSPQANADARNAKATGRESASMEDASEKGDSEVVDSTTDASWRDAGASRLDIRI